MASLPKSKIGFLSLMLRQSSRLQVKKVHLRAQQSIGISTPSRHNNAVQRTPRLFLFQRYSTVTDDNCQVVYKNSLPVLTVPLPSRSEACSFPLRPLSHTVGDFLEFIQDEDLGVDHAVIYSSDGIRIAKSTPIELLLRDDFQLVINDRRFTVKPPSSDTLGTEHLMDFDHIREQVARMYTTLNVENYQMGREKELLQRLEEINCELNPLERQKQQLDSRSMVHTRRLTWIGLGFMGIQFGLFARLTWWEYSWDIMEPVTYFATYGTAAAMFAYYVLTKQEYTFPDVRNREHLLSFHRRARKINFDVDRYNHLHDLRGQALSGLEKLRDPLLPQLPLPHLQKKPALSNQPPVHPSKPAVSEVTT